jgi:hypothetical protein
MNWSLQYEVSLIFSRVVCIFAWEVGITFFVFRAGEMCNVLASRTQYVGTEQFVYMHPICEGYLH